MEIEQFVPDIYENEEDMNDLFSFIKDEESTPAKSQNYSEVIIVNKHPKTLEFFNIMNAPINLRTQDHYTFTCNLC